MKIPPAGKHFLLKGLLLFTSLGSAFLLNPRGTAAAEASLSIITEGTDIRAEGKCQVNNGLTDGYLRLWLNINMPHDRRAPTATPLPPTPVKIRKDRQNFSLDLGRPQDLGLSPGNHFISARCSVTLATFPALEDYQDVKASFTITTPGGGVHSDWCPGGYANTAIGKIPCSPRGLAGAIFGLALGIAGGIALLLIIIGGYKVMASQGDPEAIAAGKEIITSAISGLLFIIFSAVILKIIGIQILGLPPG